MEKLLPKLLKHRKIKKGFRSNPFLLVQASNESLLVFIVSVNHFIFGINFAFTFFFFASTVLFG